MRCRSSGPPSGLRWRAAADLGAHLDILVANAGIELREAFGAATQATGERLFRLNLMATLELVQAASASMRAAGCGWIVAVGSIQRFACGRIPRWCPTAL